MINKSQFGHDPSSGRKILRLEDEKALEGLEFRAFGSDYPEADTLFTVWVDGERVLTKRPEPVMIEWLEWILDDREFILEVMHHSPKVVTFDDDRVEKFEAMVRELEKGLKDAPIKQ